MPKPIVGVMLPQPKELKLGKNSPPFSQGRQGGLNKCLIIPLNPPLNQGDLKLPFPSLHRLRKNLCSIRQVLQQLIERLPKVFSDGGIMLIPPLEKIG